MKEMKYNYFRSRNIWLGIALLLVEFNGLYIIFKKYALFALLIYLGILIWAVTCILISFRYKAHAIIDHQGIRVCTKNSVLATVSWDDIVKCEFCNVWGPELSGLRYTVLFTKNAKSLDPNSFNLNRELFDRHMYALYKRKMTFQEFENLEVIVLWVSGGKAETDEIECMINNYKNRNNGDKTEDDTGSF